MIGPKPPVRFEDPDPKAICINQLRLDEHLKAMGQRQPLKIRALLDALSFTAFEAVYGSGGRPPFAPQAMLGLILSGIVEGVTSLRDVERFARLNAGCWWVTGGIMPDHSVIGRFIQRHEAVLTEGFFEDLTRQVLHVTRSSAAVVAGDGTVIEAAASQYRLLRAEALDVALRASRVEAGPA
jgi:transposase